MHSHTQCKEFTLHNYGENWPGEEGDPTITIQCTNKSYKESSGRLPEVKNKG